MHSSSHALSPRPVRRVGLVPFGISQQKPRHFLEMLRVGWENRDQLGYAYRVLTRGVCDGCALGTSGLRDWTLDGTHLCLVRLNLLRLNTMGPAPAGAFCDAEALARLRGKELRNLGRIAHPLRRRRGEAGFAQITWQEALEELGQRFAAADPDRMALFMTSRGITNEVYYAAQRAWRMLGSPHVDNAARLCHSPSTAAMKRTLGVAASTCSYRDWYGSDLVVFFGSNPANDQPVAIKYLYEAKRLGTRVVAVNTFEEPGLKRYWIPSTYSSALFGSRICDEFFSVSTGGDLALLQAVQRRLIELDLVDHDFVANHTTGYDSLREGLLSRDIAELIEASGSTAEQVERLATLIGRAKSAVFVWSMGLTQHAHGSDTVAALCTLALMRGFVGRERCGLMPIRGHSGVQGGAEMGAYANVYPGGAPINEANADLLAGLWAVRPPVRAGMSTAAMVDAALRGELEVLYSVGGNLRDTLPDPGRVEDALAQVPVRIHQDIVFSHAMLAPPRDVVYVLPARTRYEHRGGVTETTTERRVVYSPYVPGHELDEAKEEWWIPLALARAAKPELAPHLDLDAEGLRAEIAQAIPYYRGIERLKAQGDQFQWGGPRLCEGGDFPLPEGKARLELTELPKRRPASGEFWLATRRGKQFNSMIQAEVDALTGAARDHVLMHPDDMRALGLRADQRVRLVSAHGQFEGRAFAAAMTPGNLQMHWPESNVLLSSAARDPAAEVPDYNARVRVEPLP